MTSCRLQRMKHQTPGSEHLKTAPHGNAAFFLLTTLFIFIHAQRRIWRANTLM